MEHQRIAEIFQGLLVHLRNGDPVPLDWAVDYAADLPAAWRESDNVVDLLQVPAFVVPRRPLVLAFCQIARRWDQHPTETIAIESAEAWANAGDGAAPTERITRLLGILNVDIASAPTFAAIACCFAVVSQTRRGVASYANRLAHALAAQNPMARAATADFVRAQFATRDIVADVMQANRLDAALAIR